MGFRSVLMPLTTIALSILGIALSAIALSAGHGREVLEDYAIIRLNTSGIGLDVIRSLAYKASHATGGSVLDDTAEDIEGLLSDETKKHIERFLHEFKIPDWYSLHILTACQGSYVSHLAGSSSLNTTDCISLFQHGSLNISKILDHDFRIGSLHVNPANLEWVAAIQKSLDFINGAARAILGFYVIEIVMSAAALLSYLAHLGLRRRGLLVRRLTSQATKTFMTLGALTADAAMIITLVASAKSMNEVRQMLHAQQGDKFLMINCFAAAAMTVLALLHIALL